jgi:hypothetical protein
MRMKDNPTTPVHFEAEGHGTTNPQIQSPNVVNRYERQVIESLTAWVAEEQNAALETVRSVTEGHFGVDEVAVLPRKDYDDVIRFLVELRLDEVKQ